MQISPEDRTEDYTSNTVANKSTTGKLLLLVVAASILAGLGYYLLKQSKTLEPLSVSMSTEEISAAVPPPPLPPASASETTPKIEIPEQVIINSTPNFVLPTLDNSDSDAKKYLNSLIPEKTFSHWFHPEHLIRRGVTFIDGLSRGIQLSKMHKAPTPKGKFLAVKKDGTLWLNQENYRRYDYLINVIQAIDSDKLVNVFHLFRPLLEEAYGELGYSPKNFDSAIVSALDQILAAPVHSDPIALTRDSVQYQYADQKLEALPPIQKQLLRMGSINTQIIQKKAQLLREALLRQ